MKNEEFDLYDDDEEDFFFEDEGDFFFEDEGDFETLEEALKKSGLSIEQLRRELSNFMLWMDAMENSIGTKRTPKAIFCDALCNTLKEEFSGDLAKLWCICVSEHSDFIFEDRTEDDEEYRLFNYLKLKEETDGLMSRLKKELHCRNEFKRLSENVTFSDEAYAEIDAEEFIRAISRTEDFDGECLADNIRCVCDKVSRSKELSRILPDVFYALFTRCRKKMLEKEGYEPNFPALFRTESYDIEKDNGKNQTRYTEHIGIYEAMCAYFKPKDKLLCDTGFSMMSNICRNDSLPWYEFPDFTRPLAAELNDRYFTCFPNGLADNPIFTANDIDTDALIDYEEYYDRRLPPKLRVIGCAEEYLRSDSRSAESYISLLKSGETNKCVRIVLDIIERSDIDPSVIKPDMVNIVNAVILEQVFEDINRRIKTKMLELLPVLQENYEKEC